MSKIIRGEMLKGKRSFGRKSLILFPLLVSGMAIFLMGGELTQIGAYNWWYMLLLPMVVGLVCTNLVDADKRLGFYNCNVLPISPAKMWHGKIWTGLLYLAFSNAVVFVVSIAIPTLARSRCGHRFNRHVGVANSFRALFGYAVSFGRYISKHSLFEYILFQSIDCGRRLLVRALCDRAKIDGANHSYQSEWRAIRSWKSVV
jgi:hypothetical protein